MNELKAIFKNHASTFRDLLLINSSEWDDVISEIIAWHKREIERKIIVKPEDEDIKFDSCDSSYSNGMYEVLDILKKRKEQYFAELDKLATEE